MQLDVLDQVERPKLVACDTMNFWIQSRRPDLLTLLGKVDLVTLNDAEARQLSEKANLVQAAQWIMSRGPRHVIIKKGEHGAFMFTESSIFFAPAFPLENVFDPTGAGDSFAGGFIGYIAATNDLSEANMRRAVIYGSVMGSFAADHLVRDGDAFTAAVRAAIEGAEGGLLMTIGITPTHPETGYGYLECGPELDGGPVRRVNEFKEKPSYEVALPSMCT